MSQPYFPSDYSNYNDFSPSRRQRAYGLDAKIVVLGNSGVGKTSLLQRYVQNNYSPDRTQATTSAFFAAKRVYVDNQKVRLQLWDTAGQERFRSMAPIYYRGANAAILLYDITSLTTFEDLKSWLQELKRNCTPDLIIYIVGAKMDLCHQREITLDRVRASLRNWFPPPSPPPPSSSSSPSSPSSNIRPRFTSFTSITMTPVVPFLSTRSRTQSDSQPVPRPIISASTHVSTPTKINEVCSPALVRRRTKSQVEPYRLEHAPIDAALAPSALMSPDRKSLNFAPFPSKEVIFPHGIKELPEEDSDTDESDYEWGVQENMKLFEVSAKDDKGVQELFEHLIRGIIAKRGVIEREREQRERDSVCLTNDVPRPSWANVADEEEARQANTQRWGGSCC